MELRAAIEGARRCPEALEAARRIYSRIERELSAIKPVCQMSGRCCRFEQYGHRLFVTTVELALFAEEVRGDQSVAMLATGVDGDGCRFQQGKICRAHQMRPMGCRLFFCDAAAEQKLQQLYEQMHAAMKEIHDEFHLAYHYVEWRQGLCVLSEMTHQTPR